jgi:RNAse (barnase) inhibitor barstar
MEITVDFSKIKNKDTFHSLFSKIMGFPGFYRENWDAWIDCMSCIDAPEAGMSIMAVKSGESLEIIILGIEAAIKSCPEVFQEFVECIAFVNHRFAEWNKATRLKLIFLET